MPAPAKARSAWLIAALAALVSAAFFGLNAVASKRLYAEPAVFDAQGLFVARGVWSLPLFIALAAATRPAKLPPIDGRTVALFLLCGLAYGPGTNALSAMGAHATSASHAVLLLSLFPPLASFMAAIFLRERLSPFGIAAIVTGVLGAVVLALSKSGGGSTLVGDGLIAAFILAWAVMSLIVRQLDATWPPLFVVGVFGTIGCLMLAAIGAGIGRLDAALVPLHHADVRTILWFDLEMVVLLSLGGQLLQGLALRTLNVAIAVALTSYGSIFAGMAASIALLGEKVSAGEVGAGVLLVAALGLSLVRRRPPSNGAPSAAGSC